MQFPQEHFILLFPEEIQAVTGAANRDDFQPELSLFLHATGNLSGLRRLSLPAGNIHWNPPSLAVQKEGHIQDATGQIRGQQEYFHLPARPGEAQMGISYDWFWSEFHAFLRRHYGIWACSTGDQWMSVCPLGVSFQAWHEFWQYLGSLPHLKKSLGIFLHHKKLSKQRASAWDSSTIPILSSVMAQYLLDFYQSKHASSHFTKESIPQAIEQLQILLQRGSYTTIPFPLPASQANYVKGGDFGRSKCVRCTACGEIVSRQDCLERKSIFLKDADERPQSGSRRDQCNMFCNRCVATSFLCPVKLKGASLSVKFLDNRVEKNRPVPMPIEMELRKFVAYSFDSVAGYFVTIHIVEKVAKKNLCDYLGAYHYALWKTAVTFPPELFAQGFSLEVYPGEEIFYLPCWSLWFVSALADWDNVFQYNCYHKDNFRPFFSQCLRLISQKRIFPAFYTLLSGKLIATNYIGSYKANILQDIWSELEVLLQKENPMPIPNYPQIAGMVGLLLPMAERVESTAGSEKEKKRAIGKLLEEVDRPIQYAYTAARESSSSDFFFFKKPKNRYFFEKALQLLKWAGEDVDKLQANAKKRLEDMKANAKKKAEPPDKFAWAEEYDQKIMLGPDQIVRVTSALVSEGEKPPYANEAVWRDFAYQVKLALWSMFPQYLGSQDR